MGVVTVMAENTNTYDPLENNLVYINPLCFSKINTDYPRLTGPYDSRAPRRILVLEKT